MRAIGEVLAGTNKILIATGGTAASGPSSEIFTEKDAGRWVCLVVFRQ